MVDFRYFLNRQGVPGTPGEKGEKGDPGNTPTISEGTNTATEYTLIFDSGNGNQFETGNLRNPVEDRGGTYLRWDGETQYLGAIDEAQLNGNLGGVRLAYAGRIESENVQDNDAVSYQLFASNNITINTAISGLDNRVTALEQAGGGGGSVVAYDGVLTVKKNGNTVGTFSANQSTNSTINISVPTKTSDLSNDSGFLTRSDISGVYTYKGSVANTSALNNIQNPSVGDVYNVTADNMNYAWTGSVWDALGSSVDLSNYVQKTDIATTGALGLVKPDGTTITIDGNGVITAVGGGGGGTTYTAGNGISISSNTISAKVDGTTIGFDSSGNLKSLVSSSSYTFSTGLTESAGTVTLNTASTSALGGVKVDGVTISIDSNGVISASSGSSYTLPAASTTVLGGIMVDGTILTVNAGTDVLEIANATSSNKGIVQVDGTTITANNGVISAVQPSLSNYVTLDGAQSITGTKTFKSDIRLEGYNKIVHSNGAQSPVDLMYASTSSTQVYIGNATYTIELKGSANNPTYNGTNIALSTDLPTTMTGAGASSAGASGLVPAPASGDNEKFLRGDGTWQTVSGGGGGSSTLAGLSDVNLSSPAAGDILYYNGTNWVNSNLQTLVLSILSDSNVAKTINNATIDGGTV